MKYSECVMCLICLVESIIPSVVSSLLALMRPRLGVYSPHFWIMLELCSTVMDVQQGQQKAEDTSRWGVPPLRSSTKDAMLPHLLCQSLNQLQADLFHIQTNELLDQFHGYDGEKGQTALLF